MSASDPARLPRLLAGWNPSRPLDLIAHEGIHGRLPLARRSHGREHPLISELHRAGLYGHGGASFPTATKLRAVAAQRARPVIVVNATEGDPLSAKDRLLIRHLPHLVLDGAVATAVAVGAQDITVALDAGASGLARSVERAISERPEIGPRGLSAATALVADGYLSGQDTALLSALAGGSGRPTTTPPYPAQRGLRGKPTFVANTETLAQVALIARYGADWFRRLGSGRDPGSRLVTISGAVAEPGVIEIVGGTPLPMLLRAAGGVNGSAQAILLGGYGGVWVGAGAAELKLGSGRCASGTRRLGRESSLCSVTRAALSPRWHAPPAGWPAKAPGSADRASTALARS